MAETLGPVGPVVAAWVVRGYADDLWELYAYDPPFAAAGDRPRACPLARYQAARGREVTSRLHRPVLLSDDERALVARLDGSQARDQLPGGAEAVETMLTRLADAAVLVG